MWRSAGISENDSKTYAFPPTFRRNHRLLVGAASHTDLA